MPGRNIARITTFLLLILALAVIACAAAGLSVDVVEAHGHRARTDSIDAVALAERRWYLAGAEGTLIADLVRNRLMVRRALNRAKPERIDYGGLTADAHNGADQAMAIDLLAALEGRVEFPVTPWDSMEAGLTVMAIDRAMAESQVVDCAPMWEAYDAARDASDLK